jgi:hypothetical protein
MDKTPCSNSSANRATDSLRRQFPTTRCSNGDHDLDKDDMCHIKAITGHRKVKLPDTIGDWEVRVQWASGATTWNALNQTEEKKAEHQGEDSNKVDR